MKSFFNLCFLLAALAAVGAGACAWKEYREIARLRAQVADLTDTKTGLEKRLADAAKRAKSLQDALAAQRGRRAGGAEAAGQPDGAEQARGNRRGGPNGRGAFFAQLSTNPQFVKLMAMAQKTGLDSRYAALFKMLNLSPAQLDALKNLLVERQQAQFDALSAARDQGISPRNDPAGFQQVLNDAVASVETQIKTDLGDSAYSQYQQYQQTLPERGVANQLQLALSYTGSPLSDSQANQLVQTLAQNAPAGAANPLAGMGGFMGQAGGGAGVPITAQTITAASNFLSGPQMAALQQLQQQQQAQQQILQSMRASRQASGN